jgi:hypothetical protein
MKMAESYIKMWSNNNVNLQPLVFSNTLHARKCSNVGADPYWLPFSQAFLQLWWRRKEEYILKRSLQEDLVSQPVTNFKDICHDLLCTYSPVS